MALQAWFPLSCDLLDYGPHKLQLETRTNATMSAETFNTGGSVYFNNGYLRYTLTQAFKNSFSENKMSLSCWIKTTYTSYKQLCKIGTNGTGWADLKFGMDVTTQPYLCVADSNNTSKTITAGPTVTNGSWHHLVGIYDAGDMKLYIDNVLVKTDTTTAIPDVTNANAYIYLGGSGSGERMSPGNLKDARFYNHALTEDEIASLYRVGIPRKSLLVWLPLNGHTDNQGILSNSITINGDPLTLTNYGKIGKTYQFTGSTYFEIAGFDFSGEQPWSIAVWHKINNGPSYQPIFWLAPSNNEIGGLCPHGSQGERIEGGTISNKFDITGNSTGLTNGQWCHQLFIYDGTNIKIYRNNILVQTITYTWPSTYHLNHLYIAKFWSSSYFSGNIQDFRLYNYALSDSERNYIYQTKILHYPLNIKGNPNLLPKMSSVYGTQQYRGYCGGTVTMTDEKLYDGHQVMKITPASNSISSGANTNTLCRLQADVTYCYSCMIYSTIADHFDFGSLGHMQTWHDDSPNIDKAHNDYLPRGTGVDIPANQWTQVYYTFTPNMDNVEFRSYFIYFANTSQIIYVTNIKLEVGTSPTPWIPHVDDMPMNWHKEYDGSGNRYTAIAPTNNRKISLISPRYCSCQHFTNIDEALFVNPFDLYTDYYTVSFWSQQSQNNKMVIGSMPNMNTSETKWYKYGGQSWKWQTNTGTGEQYYSGTAGRDTNNVWHHFAFASDKNNIYIYRDGNLIDTVNKSTIASIDGYTNWPYLSIGVGYAAGYFDNDSYVSDVRIYASALSATEILKLYNLKKI